MNNKFFQIFNYGSLVVVVILLILMLTKAVPKDSYIELLAIAIFLFVVRIILRIYFVIQSKKNK